MERKYTCYCITVHLSLFFKCIFKKQVIFREKGREGGREGEKLQCVVASHVSLTGNLARNPGMCPDWQPLGSQDRAQSTELHQPGWTVHLLNTQYYWCPDSSLSLIFPMKWSNTVVSPQIFLRSIHFFSTLVSICTVSTALGHWVDSPLF